MSFISSRTVTGNALVLLLGLATIAGAQGPGGRRGFGGPGGGFGPGGFGGFGLGGGKVVTGAPYSATRVTSFVQVLSDGNSVSRENCSKVYRDSQGRTRQEDTPNASACSATPAMVVIRDPVAGVEYFINTQNSTYRQRTIKAPPSGSTAQRPNRPSGPNSGQVQTTTVACPAISGFTGTIEGTQTSRTIPAGQIGNSQPITITSTRCYSPDLQVVVYSDRNDPRGGKMTSQLSNISLAEPDASLFQLPSGLTQQQGFGRRFRQGR
jgi:hypothetical protein